MKTLSTQRLLPACLALLCAGISATLGCNNKKAEATPSAAAAIADPLRVLVPDDLMRSISLGKAQWQEVTTEQKVAARVQTDASRVARIGSPVEGRITRVLVFEGERVRQGQVLAMLHSNALSDTQFAFVKAVSQENLARQASDRARQLVQSDVIGTAELQKREAEVLQSATEVAALRAQLHGLGMSESAISYLKNSRQLTSEYPIIASIPGTVIERKITVGQVVQPADPAFMVADLSQLWLVAEIPEPQAGFVTVGKTVIATIPALPDEEEKGKLSFVSPVVNPETRTVQARMELPNPKRLFKPDMLASMTFESLPEKGMTIPSTAVVRENNKDNVFVQKSDHEFRLHEVELGPEVADRRVVLRGIKDDDTLVLDGAFHLNNKRKQDQIKGGE